jgi:hypothetical protein
LYFSCHRKYEEACAQRAARRVAFTRAFHERYGRKTDIHYPQALKTLPKFADWLRHAVVEAANNAEKPSEEEVEESRLLERVGTAYCAMYAHGMHLRIKSTEVEKVTCDSGVASTVTRQSRARVVNKTVQFKTAEYVGNLSRPHPKVVRDEYGFVVGNFVCTVMPLGPNSFAFPTQCIQVFYSDDIHRTERSGRDWKVICGTDIRGKRRDLNVGRPEIALLAAEHDSNFPGLRVT